MYKKFVIAVILCLIPLVLIANHVIGANSKKVEGFKSQGNTSEFRYTSGQFTKPEPVGQKLKQNFSLDGYVKVAENNDLTLYVKKESLAIKLQNKQTGYVWSSEIDQIEQYRLNKKWQQIVQSAITIDYLDRKQQVRQESILTNKSNPKLTMTKNGFTADILFLQAKVKMQLKVELENNGLTVSIPKTTIKEDKYNKLISIQLYPFFGSVHQNDIQGYMFIPDGSGALIRYEKSKKTIATPYIGSIYGVNEGIKTKANTEKDVIQAEQINVPVFGAVHGTNKNGFLTIIEDGAYYGDIVAFPAGTTTDFNRISSQFHYRYDYFQPTSKQMKGINIYQKEMNPVNIKLRYVVLSNEDADYVGMAKYYRNYLLSSGQLEKREDKVNVRLEFLGGENKKGLIWDKVLPMTPINEIPNFVQQLKNEGAENLFVIYKGWSKGGLTGTLPKKFPVEKSIGNKNDVKSAIETLQKLDTPIYFYTDYTKAYSEAKGFSNKDVAKKISSATISNNVRGLQYFYLSPYQSLKNAKEDLERYREYGIKNISVDSTASIVFSDFNKNEKINREESVKKYEEIFNILKQNLSATALYKPNVYAWKHTDKFLDIPMNASNFMYETDTVPFIQIVLKGNLPFYANFSNFYSNPEDQLLRMVEYGAYPSFLLTKEPSHILMDTSSSDVYTSEFDIWKSKIIHQYKTIKETLGQVESATIEKRYVPKAGIVEVSYSNGKTIIVNYNDSDYITEKFTVQGKGFIVVEMEGEQ